MNKLRRLLGLEISIAGLLELGLWLALPNVVIGIAVAFLNPQYAHAFSEQFAQWLPAGAHIAGFGTAMVLWPVLILAPHICVA